MPNLLNPMPLKMYSYIKEKYATIRALNERNKLKYNSGHHWIGAHNVLNTPPHEPERCESNTLFNS